MNIAQIIEFSRAKRHRSYATCRGCGAHFVAGGGHHGHCLQCTCWNQLIANVAIQSALLAKLNRGGAA